METFLCQDGCCTLKIKPYVAQDLQYENFHVRRKKSGVFICDPKTNKVLIVQSRGHLWGPPKGTMEDNETDAQCAVREVMEETGLDISKESLTTSFAVYNKATYFYLEMNECDVSVQEKDPTNDANGIGWIKIECLEKCIDAGNISISGHLRLLFKQLHGRIFSHPTFILVNRKKQRSRSQSDSINLITPLEPYSG
jgi:ADP-ribose pyrophosphatase YjhB (NUDIX family)